MKEFETLYARNSNGSINRWTISVEPRGNYVSIIIKEGVLNGQISLTERMIKKGKNIGKMNETTVMEQAISESQSRWENKKKKGYKSLSDLGFNNNDINNSLENGTNSIVDISIIDLHLPKNRTDANNISKPMKAQQYFKDNGEVRIKFPCFGQPKLNGFRVIARWETVKENEGTLLETEAEKVVFRSKEGMKYDVLEHIEAEFTKEMFFESSDGSEIAFDGEMYIHGEILSEISSAVRKRNPKTSLLKFYIFDLAVEKVPQNTRLDRLSYIDTQILCNKSNIIGVFRNTINSNEQAQAFTDECIAMGYEGAIFRDMKAEYQFGKRPQTMTKLKRSEDKEFKIINVVGGEFSPDLGMFVCVAENGLEFTVTPEGSHETRREYLINKENYIGKDLTVRFFERTKEGKPFHAVGVVRDYE